MKKRITWEEATYGKKVHKITVEFPVYYIDQYGYVCYSKDGITSVEIGLNGIQCNKENTHSIETHNYFSGERYNKRKKDIPITEYRKALNDVNNYIKSLINETL